MVAIRTGAREVLKLEPNDVRFTPESGHVQCKSACPLRANSGHQDYSMTSAARATNAVGRVSPRFFAAVRFMTNS